MTGVAVQQGRAYGQSTLSPEQVAMRRAGIGASEVAAICGLDHRRTPLDVWLSKRGEAEPMPDNQFLQWGRRMEGVIREAYATDCLGDEGLSVVQPGTLLHPESQWMLCTPDGIVSGCDCDSGWRGNIVMGTLRPCERGCGASASSAWVRGLECKNRDGRVAYLWGDPGTDQIPDDVAAQCHWSMAVTGLKRWDCAALIGGNDFRVYTLHWDEEIAADFIAIAHEFWHVNVLGGKEPAITGPSAKQYLQRKFGSHNTELVVATPDVESLLEQYGSLKVRVKEIAQALDATELQLQAAVGNAAGVKGTAGVYTWKMTKASIVERHERAASRRSHWTPTKEKR
jgi:putative phage-type endonuclease